MWGLRCSNTAKIIFRWKAGTSTLHSSGCPLAVNLFKSTSYKLQHRSEIFVR